MHGVNWDAMTAAYRKFLPHIDNNYDFAELLSEWLGELNVSHTGGRFYPDGQSEPTASLGLLFDWNYQDKGMLIAEVIEKGPFDKATTKVKAGVVIEKIDGKTIATKNGITLGATQTLSVVGNTFTALTNAKHTITITATDSAGNSAVRTLTFTKSIAGFVITLSAPLEADSQPTRANVKVTRDIPAGGTFKVEVTNNPFDASPVWEDCTNAVVQGVAHVFTNKINTAAQYGMNIRVTVQRGDALTACWVSGIGGNFE